MKKKISQKQILRIQTLSKLGRTHSVIRDMVGVSRSTVHRYAVKENKPKKLLKIPIEITPTRQSIRAIVLTGDVDDVLNALRSI